MKTPVENIVDLLTTYRNELQKDIKYKHVDNFNVNDLDNLITKINNDFKTEEKNELILAWNDGCYNEKPGHPKTGKEYLEKRFE